MAKKKSRKGLWITLISIASVIVLAGGGIALWYGLQKPAPTVTTGGEITMPPAGNYTQYLINNGFENCDATTKIPANWESNNAGTITCETDKPASGKSYLKIEGDNAQISQTISDFGYQGGIPNESYAIITAKFDSYRGDPLSYAGPYEGAFGVVFFGADGKWITNPENRIDPSSYKNPYQVGEHPNWQRWDSWIYVPAGAVKAVFVISNWAGGTFLVDDVNFAIFVPNAASVSLNPKSGTFRKDDVIKLEISVQTKKTDASMFGGTLIPGPHLQLVDISPANGVSMCGMTKDTYSSSYLISFCPSAGRASFLNSSGIINIATMSYKVMTDQSVGTSISFEAQGGFLSFKTPGGEYGSISVGGAKSEFTLNPALIKNGRFETCNAKTGVADSWINYYGEAYCSSTFASSGTYAGLITGNGTNWRALQQDVTLPSVLTAATTGTLSFKYDYISSPTLTRNFGGVKITYLSAQKTVIGGPYYAYVKDTQNATFPVWQDFSTNLSIPAGTAKIIVHIFIFKDVKGYFLLDDVDLKVVGY